MQKDITEPVIQLLGIGLTVSGSSALSVSSALSASALLRNLAGSSLSVQSDLSSSATLVAGSASALSIESNLVSNGIIVFIADSSMDSDSSLTASSLVVAVLDSTLTAESTLVATATVISAPVYISSEFSLVAEISSIVIPVEANLSGNIDLNSAILIGIQASAQMTAEVSLSVTETIVNAAASIVVGSSNLTASPLLVSFQMASIFGESNLSSAIIVANIATPRPLSGQSSLTATMFQPLNILNLPVVEYEYTNDRLMKFYGIDSGQSLIITGTVGKIVEFQTGTEIEAADYYFGGGRRHVLTDVEVTAVQNAGFGNLITIEGVPSGV